MQGDFCNVSLALKTSCSVPKEAAAKARLFNYITTAHGKDVLDEMLTINARTFSSWVDKEVEAKNKEGDIDFKLDMLAPYDYYSLGMRKRAVKK